MWVYLLRSQKNQMRTYVGLTGNWEKRLFQHNEGEVTATYKFRPWDCEVRIWFEDSEKAKQFEKYLKSGSGRAFSQRHFFNDVDHPPKSRAGE